MDALGRRNAGGGIDGRLLAPQLDRARGGRKVELPDEDGAQAGLAVCIAGCEKALDGGVEVLGFGGSNGHACRAILPEP